VTNCSTLQSTVGDLNLPSFSVVFTAYGDRTITLSPVMRNIGDEVDVVYIVSSRALLDTCVKVTSSKLALL
jgi:hypothetical protein